MVGRICTRTKNRLSDIVFEKREGDLGRAGKPPNVTTRITARNVVAGDVVGGDLGIAIVERKEGVGIEIAAPIASEMAREKLVGAVGEDVGVESLGVLDGCAADEMGRLDDRAGAGKDEGATADCGEAVTDLLASR
jgi:hypothetical protein